MVWYSHLSKSFPQFIVIHTIKGFGIVNETEVHVFLEFPNFLYDPANVGSLISGSSSFSKSSLDIWKFLVCIMLKPSMQDFKHDHTSMSYFKSWKMMLWRCCTQYASKFGKLSSGHRTGKGQFSFQSQRKPMPKNAQTTAQLHSSHVLVK